MAHWGMTSLPIGVRETVTDPLDTDTSTDITVRQMIGIVRQSITALPIANVIHTCLQTLPRDPSQRRLARCFYQWIQQHVVFVEDEMMLSRMLGWHGRLDKELLIYPEVVVSMPHPMGDCDDLSMLLATLLITVGIKCWFVVIAADTMVPGKWSHVYVKCALEDEGVVLPLDVSHGDQIGWEYNGTVYRRMEYAI